MLLGLFSLWYTAQMRWFLRLFSPRWKRNRQDLWWPTACIHADNTPHGTPLSHRRLWDALTGISPKAPMEYRPFYVLKVGRPKVTQSIAQEIQERTQAGYRVVFIVKEEDITWPQIKSILDGLRDRDSLPWGFSIGNELDLQRKLSPADFKKEIIRRDWPGMLHDIAAEYGIRVSPPAFSSFANAGREYGEVIRELFGHIAIFVMVHSYGRLQPKYYVEFDLAHRVRLATGQPQAEIIVAESANNFVGEDGKEQEVGIDDHQGMEFMEAAGRAGCQTGIAMCHFMLYHRWHHFNDISHTDYGELRRLAIPRLIEDIKRNGVGEVEHLELSNPRGKELATFDELPQQ